MSIINIFKRRAGFQCVPMTTFEAMGKRHSAREKFDEPQTYAEFMKRYGEVGQRCNFAKPCDTEEMLWRSQNLQTLQRAATALYSQNQFAPASMRIIDKNIKKWIGDLKPKTNALNITRQLCRHFGEVVQLAFNFGP